MYAVRCVVHTMHAFSVHFSTSAVRVVWTLMSGDSCATLITSVLAPQTVRVVQSSATRRVGPPQLRSCKDFRPVSHATRLISVLSTGRCRYDDLLASRTAALATCRPVAISDVVACLSAQTQHGSADVMHHAHLWWFAVQARGLLDPHALDALSSALARCT